MGAGQLKSYINKYGEIVRGGILFLFIYLFFCLCIDLRLVYHVFGATNQISGFICRYRFFHESLITPGGMLNYISTFIEQFYMFQWIGPLFVVAIMGLSAIMAARAFKKLAVKGAVLAMYCPAIILLVCYRVYLHHLEYALALLLSLVLFNVYLSVKSSSIPVRLAIFVGLFMLQFHIALASCFIFSILCVIAELVIRGRARVSLAIALVSAVLPYIVGMQILSLCINDVYARYLPLPFTAANGADVGDLIAPVSFLYLAVPVFLLLCGIGGKLYAKKIAAVSSGKDHKRNKNKSNAAEGAGLIKWIVVTFLLAAVVCGSIYGFQKKSFRRLLNLQLLVSQQKWPEVLEASLEVSLEEQAGMYSANARNRALYHMSRLPEDMFKYPQHIKSLILAVDREKECYWMRSDLAVSLGLCDLAQECLVETMVDFSDHPEILKKLAYVHMAKDDIKSARVYLGALSEMMFYADWANEYILKLKKDPSLASEADIQHTRRSNLSGMRGFIATPYGYCVNLLRSNKDNRMAYEYTMAYCLLATSKGLDEFAKYIHMLDDYGYKKIPRSYEQAILLYNFNSANKDKKIVLDKYKISDEAQREFDAFHNLANSFKSRPQAQGALASKYLGTYYYYFYFTQIK